MRGPGSFGESGAAESQKAPSLGLATESARSQEAGNEEFLFHLYRGSELLQDNRASEAKEELERALEMQPNDPKGQDLLAVVYFRLRMYPRAIAIYEHLRRKNPTDGALLLNLALCYLKTGQTDHARRDLEELLQHNPGHNRAWGYLGLACERLGDLRAAERAFERGGHEPLARRIRERRTSKAPESISTAPPAAEADNLRQVVANAFEELDEGELSFSLAEQDASSGSARARDDGQWTSIEIGKVEKSEDRSTRRETKKPDTRDGPPPSPQNPPSSGHPRRPTLIVGVPPAPEHREDQWMMVPASRGAKVPPSELASITRRRPFVAVPPVRPRRVEIEGDPRDGAQAEVAEEAYSLAPPVERIKTLPPPSNSGTPPPAASFDARPPSVPPRPVSDVAKESTLTFPEPGHVLIHPSGIALVRCSPVAGFATRLESIRASSNSLVMAPLSRHVKGKPTGETFGGSTSPLAHATGEGRLVLGPRPFRKLSSFVLEDETCFVREEILLGFSGELSHENGRVGNVESDIVPIVQLRGRGSVLIEALGEILTVYVEIDLGMSIRRDVVLGWFGRLVPRALPPNEAPCGHHGFVSFAGEGQILVTSA